MVSIMNFDKKLMRYLPLLVLLLWGMRSTAQSGSFGNTYVANSGVMAIFGQHNFQPGYIVTARNSPQGYVTFVAGSSWAGAANTAHVNGYVSKLGNTAFTFPVGDGVNLRTLGISAPTSTATQLGVAWFTGDPGTVTDPTDGITHNTATFTGGVTGVSKVGFWDLVPFSGSNTNGLTITASIPDVSAFSTTANLRLVGWNGSAWIDLSGGATASGNTAGSTLTGTTPASSAITAIGIGTFNPQTDLAITKVASNLTPIVDSNVVFTLVVKNNGPNNATGVKVTDMLASGYTYVSSSAAAGTNYDSATGLWTIGNLANAASVTLTVTAKVNAIGDYSNTATVSGNENDPNLTNNSVTVTPIPSASTDLSIVKTVSNVTPTVGTNVVFTLTATNNGPSEGTGINVTDLLPTGYTFVSAAPALGTTYTPGTGIWSIDNLANADSKTLTITATVNPTGVYANTATIAGLQNDPTSANNTSTAITTPVPVTDLVVTKFVDNATPAVGSNVTFSLTATNNGPSPGTGIRVLDQLPTGYTYVSSVPSGTTTYNAILGSWTIGSLASGTSATLTVTAKVNATGTYLNIATISGVENDPVTGNNSTSVVTTPTPTTDRSVIKTVNNATPAVGSNVVFTLVATNNGPSAGTGIVVTDLLPSGYAYVSATAPNGTNYNPTTGLWTIGNLANGGSATINITATLNATGEYANTATITGTENDPTPGNDTSTFAPVPVATSNLSIVKTIDNPTPYVGNNVVFNLTATNAGPSDATGVQVNDLIASGYTFISASPSIGTYNSGTGLWTIGSLTNGENATLAITAKVNSTGNYSNTATISGTQNDPNSSDNASSVTPKPIDVRLVKTGPSDSSAGNTVNYTVTVSNNGTGNALAQSIIDDVPVALTNVSWTAIAQGAAVIATGASGTGNNVAVTGDIPTGAANSIAINITGTLPSSSTVTTLANTASINTPGSPAINSNTINTTVTQITNIQIQKSGPPALFAGESYSYTISVSNSGPSDANDVVIVDTMPVGFTATNWTATPQGAATINGNASGTGNIQNLLANIPAGTGSVLVTVDGILDGDYAAATIANTATATPPGGTTVTSTATSIVSRQANVRVTKSGPANIGAGDAISYTIRIVNTGPSNAPGLEIKDIIPAEILGSTWTATTTGGATLSSTSGSGDINITGNIPAGTGVVNFVVNGTVDPATTDPEFSNTASALFPAGSPVSDPNPSSASSTINTLVDSTQDVRVSKNGPAIVNINDPITYTIVVTNAGNPDVINGLLVDNVPSSITVTGWTITPNNGAAIDGVATPQTGTSPNISISGISIPGQSTVANANLTLVIEGTVNSGTPTTFTNTVNVTTPNGSPASSVTTSVNQSTDLFVQKSGPATAVAGGPINYTIKVGNNGPLNVTDLTIQDLIPADVQNVNWNAVASGSASFIGSGNGTTNSINLTADIASGTANYITINVSGIVNASPTASAINNNVTVTSSAAITDYNLTNNASSVTTTITSESNLTIVKTVDNLTPAVGSTVVFKLTAANSGPSNGTGISVTDLLPAGYTFQSSTAGTNYIPATGVWTINSILANATASMTITAIVNANGPYTNAASINGTQNDPSPADNNSSVTPLPSPVTDLSLAKTVDNLTPAVGTNVVFTLVATNNGPSTGTGIYVNDILPSGYTYISAVPAAGTTYIPSTGLWNIGTLSSAANATLTITAKVNASGNYDNTASISGNENDPTTANNSSTASTLPIATTDRSVVKTVNKSNPAVGSNVIFTLVATNNGPSNGTAITVTDLLPAGYIYVSSTEPSATTYDPATGIWDIGTMANGISSTMTITATVNATGPYDNTATIAGTENDPTPGNNSSVSTPTPTPTTDLAVLKTVDNSNPAVGSTVVFTVAATNNGPSDATGVIVNDAIPTGYTTTGVTVTAGTVDLNSSIWTIGNLANGSTVYLSITATVLATGNYANTATISGNENDPKPDNDSSSATPIPTPSAHLNTVKTLKDPTQSTFAPGQAVVYLITVTNDGPSDATAVTITDNAPAGTTISNWTSVASAGVTYPNASGTGNLNQTLVTLVNGATATYEVTVQTPSDFTGALVNSVAATSTTPDPDPTPCTTCSTSPSTSAPMAHLNTVKTLKDPTQSTFAPGEAVVYLITVTNDGPSDAAAVNIVDNAPVGTTISNWTSVASAGVTYPNASGTGDLNETLVTLANGATASYEVTVQTPSDFTGTLVNSVTATSTTPDPDPQPCTTCSTSPSTSAPLAHLNTVKTLKDPTQGTFAPGQDVVYLITVTNDGPSDAAAVNIVDNAPVGTTISNWTSVPAAGVTYPNASGTGDLNETLVTLANGATATYEVTVQTPGDFTGTLVNSVTATSTTSDPDPQPCTTCSTSPTTSVPMAHLNTVKTLKDPTQSTFAPGQDVVYLIKVTNQGPSDAAAVNIVDNAPVGTTISNWTSVASAGVTYPNASGTGDLNETLVTLANGATATYEVTVQTPGDFTGTLVNSVTATSTTPDPDPQPCTTCSASPSTSAPLAHLNTVKTLKDPTQSTFSPGQDVVYLIKVTNQGPSDAAAVNIVDNAPVGTTISNWTSVASSGVTYPNASGTGDLNETLATLANGATAIYEVTVQTPGDFTGTLVNSVTATSTTPDPDPQPCTTCSTSPTTSAPMAHLNTVKTLKDPTQSTFAPGEAVVYLITVTNDGPSDADAVTITDNAPAGTTISNWTSVASAGVTYPNASGTGDLNETLVTLANGATATYEVTVQTPGDFTGTLVNSVTAASTTPDPDPQPCTTCSTSPAPSVPMAHLNIVKTLKDPMQTAFAPGDAVVYLIKVTNNGPSDAAAVNIVDNAPVGTTISNWTSVASSGVTYPNASGTGDLNETLVTLANGATATYEVTVQTPGDFTGTLVNSVTATSTTPDPDPQPCTTCSTSPTTSVPMAHLNTVKTLKDPTQTSFVPGQAVVYLIKVTNSGPSDAAAVSITDNAPAGTTISNWTSIASAGVTYPNASGTGDLNETLVTLANGATATYEVTVQTPGDFTGTLVNSVTATSTTPDPDPQPCTTCSTSPTTSVPMAHLNTVKTLKDPTQTSFVPGQAVVYLIKVTNSGPSDAAAVSITDNAPAGTTISNWTSIASAGVTYPNASGTGDLNETLVTLANGATATYEVTVQTPGDFTGTLVNSVTATSTTPDPDPQPCTTCSTSPTTSAPMAHLNTVKTLKDPTQSTFAPGEAVVYLITVTNDGPSDADAVTITDNAPVGTTISNWTSVASAGVTYPNASGTGDLNETLVTLANGATATYEVTVQTPGDFTGTLVNSVTAASTTPDPDPQPCTTCSTSPAPSVPMAHLNIVKTLKDPMQTAFAPGDAVVYLIKVTNNGPSDAAAVNIVDNAPVGTTISNWTSVASSGVTYPNASGTGDLNETLVTLANGATATYEVTVQTPGNFTGTLVNTVTATSTTLDPNPTPCTTCSTSPTTAAPLAHLNTVKTLKDPTQTAFAPGDAVVYLIKVTNNGPSDAAAVTITDNAPAGTTISNWTSVAATGVTYPNASGTGNLNQTLATLANGATATYEVTVQTPGDFTGTLVNSVTATSTTPDPNPTPCTTCSTSPAPSVPMAHLNTVKTLKDPTQTAFAPGDAVVYLIKVTNNGPSDAAAVTITDNAPAGTTISNWTSVASTGVTYPNASGTGNLNETLATLANGATATYEVTVQTPGDFTGTLVNTVTATSTTPDPNPAPCTTCSTSPAPSVPMAHLNTVKTLKDPTQSTFVPGQAVVYLIKVTNNGPSDAAAVTITDNAPAGTIISNWTSVASTGVAYPNASGTGDLNETLATLANGATATYEVTVQTPGDFTGTLVNSVTATSTTLDPNPTPCTTCSTSPTTAAPLAHLNTVKTLKDPTQTAFAPGDAVVYLIKVTNNGPSDAAAVTITDNAPAGTTISNWTSVASTGVTYPNASGTGNLNETLATLANGATATYEVTVQTPGNFTGTLVNTVTATSTTPDPNPTPCTTCSTSPAPSVPMAHLNTVKTLKDPTQTTFAPGDAVVYLIKVTNQGPSDAAAVSITDNAPSGTTISNWTSVATAGVTYPNASGTGNLNETLVTLANGATATYEVTVQTPADFTGTLVNSVTATSTTPDPNPRACTTCSSNPIIAGPKVVPGAHLNTVKTLKDPSQTTFVPGEEVIYRITVTNQGPGDAESVNIIDNAPTGTTISSWSTVASSGVTYPNASGIGDLNETLAILGNGLVAIYEVTVKTPILFAGTTLVNSVTTTSTTTDPSPGPCTTCSTNPTKVALPGIFIPNVITPDGDGFNDKFVIKELEYYPGSPLMIYNRWGNQVYRSDSYDNSWSATGLSGGTYYYIFKLKTTEGIKDYNGWIEVLK
ncbi:gliding motility-associated C-terminal domain-containing protein [Flavobacterium sp.]|uniref:T9SS type B sorting domain-containing protein n=1 Tax=Flavobacterium sp. TaxID=239 RepID=UPI003D0E187C